MSAEAQAGHFKFGVGKSRCRKKEKKNNSVRGVRPSAFWTKYFCVSALIEATVMRRMHESAKKFKRRGIVDRRLQKA
jgi:hypothetical protein